MSAGNENTITRISGRVKPSPMACPNCGSTLNGVTATRTMPDNSIRRRRTCAACERDWSTIERAISPDQEDDQSARPERLRTLVEDGFFRQGTGTCSVSHPPMVPLSMFFPWLEDGERSLLLASRKLSPENRRVLVELANTLTGQRGEMVGDVPPFDDVAGAGSATEELCRT